MRHGSFRKIFMILFAAVMISGLLATSLTVSAGTIGGDNETEALEEQKQKEEEDPEKETADENAIQVADVEEATAFAIYSETDNSLRFYKRTGDVPAVESEYNELKVTAVFTTDIEDISAEWLYYYQIPWHKYLPYVKTVVVEDSITPLNLRYWFYGATELTSVDVSKLDTSKVETFYCVFYNCSSLTTLDLSSWNTSSATNMGYLFCGCSSLTDLKLGNWDTSNVQSMNYIFYGCEKLTNLDAVESWNTASLVNMNSAFGDCQALTELDLSSWDTSNVTDMGYAFYYCCGLKSLNVSTWDTSKVTNMCQIFCYCSDIAELDLSTWNTRNLNETETITVNGKDYTTYCRAYMFYGMTSLWKITIGSDFVFYSDTDDWEGNKFPTPSDEYLYSVTGLMGATGNWYNTSNEEFSVANVPSGTADTYIAYPIDVAECATGHDYNVTYSWSEDNTTCTATFTCKNCGDVQTVSATVTSEVKTEATVSSKGVTTYVAVAKINDMVFVNIRNVEDIPQLSEDADADGNADSVGETDGTLTRNGDCSVEADTEYDETSDVTEIAAMETVVEPSSVNPAETGDCADVHFLLTLAVACEAAFMILMILKARKCKM